MAIFIALLAGGLFIVGCLSPLTPSYGSISAADLGNFVLAPLAIVALAAARVPSPDARRFLIVEAGLIAAFSIFLIP